MKTLFLAPQPFFQERGTPIAVRLAVQVLAQRDGDQIDLLTYHEGEDVTIPNVTLHRISAPSWLKGIAPGISIKKLICDVFYLFKAIKMVKASKERYQLVHAVEESVFIAWLIKQLYGIPYIYDMDSSLAMQVTEKWYLLKPFRPLFELMEKLAVRGSTAVVPICDALAVIADRHGSKDTQILSDISLLDLEAAGKGDINLKAEVNLKPDDLIILYIGNLESYQGIDLLIDGFAKVSSDCPNAHVVIIGGRDEHIKKYKDKSNLLGISKQVHLIGPRPVSNLADYLLQADILASPRTKGNNTPMKIYSYLHSGTPIVATRLRTHTQVLDDEVSELAEPTPGSFAKALSNLLTDQGHRMKVGESARKRAEEKYTFEAFSSQLNEIYDRVGARIGGSDAHAKAA